MMEATEFFENRSRMCDSFGDSCTECGIHKRMSDDATCGKWILNHHAEAIEIVEQWAQEHPRKTRQNELLKLFPRVDMTADGVIAFCPESMDSTFVCPIKERDSYDPECGDCRREYWLEEVEDDGN